MTTQELVKTRSAIVSPDEVYRTGLYRELNVEGTGALLWVMLNPSTADAKEDDPTIRRICNFTRDHKARHCYVVNLYDFRATDPALLLKAVTAGIGNSKANDFHLSMMGSLYGVAVCAWGKNAPEARAREVSMELMRLGVKLFCLGTNLDGSPVHPLYVPGDRRIHPWSPK
jgi:hypothetical protein